MLASPSLGMMDQLCAAAWFAYRRTRLLAYTWSGRNPLQIRIPSECDWQSVRGLFQGKKSPVRSLKTDAEGLTLWSTALGEMWTPVGASAAYVSRLALEMLSGVYLIDGQKTILDCGANVGFFSRFAFSQGAERVIAFEPSPGNAACLRRNLAKEMQEGRFTIVPKGVWSKTATLRFNTSNKGNPGGHHLDEDGDIAVDVTDIDSVTSGLARVDYIKMDVEGAELEAILGARQTISKWQPDMVIATEHGDLFENAAAVMRRMKEVAPRMESTVLEAHGFNGRLTPYSILFRNPARAREVQ